MRHSLIVIIVVLAMLTALTAIGQEECIPHRFTTHAIVYDDTPVPAVYETRAFIFTNKLDDNSNCHTLTMINEDEDYTDTVELIRLFPCATKGEIHMYKCYRGPEDIWVFDVRLNGEVEAVFNFELIKSLDFIMVTQDNCYFVKELMSYSGTKVIYYNE